MTTYAIRGGEEGKRRLDLLAQIMAPTTEALLRRLGGERQACLDLGCGGGHVSLFLAELAGPKGSVHGLDFDALKVRAARDEAARLGLSNVEFQTADITAWSASQAYDLVYGRFILSHLEQPARMIATMCEALRPGATLIVEDIDFGGAFCHPENVAYARYCELYRAVVERRGGNAHLGRELYRLCLDAGLKDVMVRAVQPVHGGDELPEKSLMLSTMINIAEAVVSEGIASRTDVDDTIVELTRFTDDPSSIIALPRVFQVWGRRPF